MTSTSARRSKKSTNTLNQTPLPNFQEAPARICAVGVGGGGTNAIIRMMAERPVPGVEYICINTDIKSLGRKLDLTEITIFINFGSIILICVPGVYFPCLNLLLS